MVTSLYIFPGPLTHVYVDASIGHVHAPRPSLSRTDKQSMPGSKERYFWRRRVVDFTWPPSSHIFDTCDIRSFNGATPNNNHVGIQCRFSNSQCDVVYCPEYRVRRRRYVHVAGLLDKRHTTRLLFAKGLYLQSRQPFVHSIPHLHSTRVWVARRPVLRLTMDRSMLASFDLVHEDPQNGRFALPHTRRNHRACR